MANYTNITASWETGTLTERMISRQFDDAATLVSFAGIPTGDDVSATYHLIVWMATEEGGEPTEQSPIQLSGPEWLISNFYTQFQQSIQFQLCIQLDGADDYEAHSPIFSGRIGKSLRHDGETSEIDTATMFDPYKEWVQEQAMAAGAVVIDNTLSVNGAAADAKAVGDAIKAGKNFVVQVPGSAAVFSGSITAGDFAKALAAYTAGSGVYAVKDGEVYQLSAAGSSTMTFTQMYHGTMNFIKQIVITSADTFTVTNTALSSSAEDTSYNNTTSGLTATNVQAAIDENAANLSDTNERLVKLDEIESRVFEYHQKTQTLNVTGTSIAAWTHIIDVTIESGQFFELVIADPDGIINPNSSGKKVLTLYYIDESDARTKFDVYAIGDTYLGHAPVNIKGFTAYTGANGITPPGNLVTTCRYTTQTSSTSLEKRIGDAESEIVTLQEPINGSMRKSENLYDPDNISVGYINASGNINANESYRYTDFIPVSEGDTLWFNCGDARTLCAFDAEKIVISSAGSNTTLASGTYTVPANVAYVRLSFGVSRIPQYPVVNVGTELVAYEPFGQWFVRDEALPEQETTDISQVVSLLGETSATITAATLSAQNELQLSDAPWFIKKNHGVTTRAKFSTFTRLLVGKGHNNYRGKWIEIDGTNITPYSYDSASVAGTPIPHGLTISDFLQVSMYVAGDGKCRISINTLSGTFNTEINYLYEWNYAPFIVGEQAMTDVKLSYSCADLRCPLWLFGDSYMGIAVNRIGGQLKNLGYFNYLINAIAGGRAVDTGTPGKSASADLNRMLEFATPKFIVWTLGMNGSKDMNISYLETLITLCQSKNIELVLYAPPSVPTIDHTDLDTFVASSGMRYIDGAAAVGATSTGVWYTDYLSTDEVHPSSLGAKALAMRFIVDVPELMQYGYSTGSVDSEIDGDEH